MSGEKKCCCLRQWNSKCPIHNPAEVALAPSKSPDCTRTDTIWDMTCPQHPAIQENEPEMPAAPGLEGMVRSIVREELAKQNPPLLEVNADGNVSVVGAYCLEIAYTDGSKSTANPNTAVLPDPSKEVLYAAIRPVGKDHWCQYQYGEQRWDYQEVASGKITLPPDRPTPSYFELTPQERSRILSWVWCRAKFQWVNDPLHVVACVTCRNDIWAQRKAPHPNTLPGTTERSD